MQTEAISAIGQVLEQKGIPYEKLTDHLDDSLLPGDAEKVAIARKRDMLLWRWVLCSCGGFAQLRGVDCKEALYRRFLSGSEDQLRQSWDPEA